MVERNERIIREGQPEIAHYCDKCMRTYRTADGIFKVEAAVTDGLTIGHPCCTMFTCPISLASNRHRFCPTHIHLCLQCAVVGCSLPVVKLSKTIDGKVTSSNMKTCSDPVHQEMERLNSEQSRANFQLSRRLMRQNVTHPTDAMANKRSADLCDLEDAEEWYEVDPDDGQVQMFTVNDPVATGELDPAVPQAPCPSKPDTGNRKIKAQFGRRRTHNEQVIVRPCGIICSRATFFGAEAVSNVLVSLSFNCLQGS
jgi:CxC6 like cysteine cluster associated with KDZ transposases